MATTAEAPATGTPVSATPSTAPNAPTGNVADDLLRIILPLGTTFSEQATVEGLAETVVMEAQAVTGADAGFLYVRTPDGALRCAAARITSLGEVSGGTTTKDVPFLPVSVPKTRPGAKTTLEANHQLRPVIAAAVTGQTVDLPDVAQAADFDHSAVIAFDQQFGYRTVSSLAVPFSSHDGTVPAVLLLLNARDRQTGELGPFSTYARQMAEAMASTASTSLAGLQALQHQKDLLKYERDIQIGRQIQQSFLPSVLPTHAGWELAACLHPARDVAGDFYDAFTLSNDRRIALVIADVCDKGVGAALFMALIRSLLRAFSQQHYALRWMDMLDSTITTPRAGTRAGNGGSSASGGGSGKGASGASGDLLESLVSARHNRQEGGSAPRGRTLPSTGTGALKNAMELTNSYIVNNHADLATFATTFFGVLDPESGLLTYVNGGHDPLILVGREGLKGRLTPCGPAVGVVPGATFRIGEVQMEPGDSLIGFTDGATDARDPSGASFTEKRLVELVTEAALAGESASGILSRIEETVLGHIATASQFDDITLLVLQRLPTT